MKVAICGYPPLALQVQERLKNSGIEFKFFIEDLVSARGEDNLFTDLPLINFFDFRRLVNAGELDGVIVAETNGGTFTKQAIHLFKFYNIPQVGISILDSFHPSSPVYWLGMTKIFFPYLESDITDRCNLNCSGCCHFANFSLEDEFYPLENFRRDISRMAQTCDVLKFRMLGGEPLVLKNFDSYLSFARRCFPNAQLEIYSNGTLIPSLPQKILDTLRETKCLVYLTLYPPTVKIFEKIQAKLHENSIRYDISRKVENFAAQMTLNGNNNPDKSIAACRCKKSRSIRNGRIYKCPIDAACYKLAKKFGLKNFASPTGIDIFSPNFPALIPMLDGEVELCHWCGEMHREIPWRISNKPNLEDYLVNPDECKNFVGG